MLLKSASVSTVDRDDSSEAEPEFVEVDPCGRYGRYKEALGKGAFKKVYRAFDEWEGIEVAWNQVKVSDLLRNAMDLERLYSEVHLLKTLKHKNIIKFYHSWVDTKNAHINFITEIFTSGTLRQYRKKHKHVDIRALKKWSRQILEGLAYLHGCDPPVIHRDLKCDNIFINGNQGEVKIGDLGLATILHHARAAHSVIGTPEFMAPELYEEEYNELVDIYSFGMCLLELVTLEYPYAECTNAAQIYKKVTAGIKPASLGKVKDPSVRVFIEKCIANISLRLSAKELLVDPFLQADENLTHICYVRHPRLKADFNEAHHNTERIVEETMIVGNRDFTVQGQRKDHNTIFLRLQIVDSSGHVRNIHFPFDIEADTSTDVASEMVEELDLTDHDISVIAAMIDSEVRSIVPDSELSHLAINHRAHDEDILENDNEFSNGTSDTVTNSYKSSSITHDRLASGHEENPIPSGSNTRDMSSIVEKIEHVLDEQLSELKELKMKHDLTVLNLLKEIPDELQKKIINFCNRKRYEYDREEKRCRPIKYAVSPSSVIIMRLFNPIIRRGKQVGSALDKYIRMPISSVSCFNCDKEIESNKRITMKSRRNIPAMLP